MCETLLSVHASFSVPAEEHVFHLVHRTLLYAGQNMRVRVQRELDAGMPEHLGHYLRVLPRRKKKRLARMAQVIQAYALRQPRRLKGGLEVAVDQVVKVQGLAILRSEH